MLDAPGCLPFREVEEVPGTPASGSRSDRHVTRRALKVSPSEAENEGVVLDTGRPDLQRIDTTVPIDLSELMKQDATHRSAIVGDAASFAAAFESAEGEASEAEAAKGEGHGGEEAPPKLACDVASFTAEHALAQFSTDGLGAPSLRYGYSALACSRLLLRYPLGNLYVMDLPGEHTLKVDGTAVGKEHKVRVWPGWTIDLSGQGCALIYQVYRDEHAHA